MKLDMKAYAIFQGAVQDGALKFAWDRWSYNRASKMVPVEKGKIYMPNSEINCAEFLEALASDIREECK